jgi:protein-S-isoprenylcysteine O-methyltransferase Ste14
MNGVEMSADRAMQWATWLWWLFAGVWIVMVFGLKRVKKRETGWERMQHLAPLAVGFWLVFRRTGSGQWLHYRLLPDVPGTWWTGVGVTALGVGFAIWARLALGTNWSGTVTLKDDHELIRNGPYRWIRHPIYTGILVAVLGTGIIRGQVRGLLGFAIILVTFFLKARREERFLRQEFGDGFEEHARRTGMFLPRLT